MPLIILTLQITQLHETTLLCSFSYYILRVLFGIELVSSFEGGYMLNPDYVIGYRYESFRYNKI
jgi:hypothetical protein